MTGINKLDGMTVNERLFARGLLEKWDLALEQRDRKEMIDLLEQIDLADQAEQIVGTTLQRQNSN